MSTAVRMTHHTASVEHGAGEWQGTARWVCTCGDTGFQVEGRTPRQTLKIARDQGAVHVRDSRVAVTA